MAVRREFTICKCYEFVKVYNSGNGNFLNKGSRKLNFNRLGWSSFKVHHFRAAGFAGKGYVG